MRWLFTILIQVVCAVSVWSAEAENPLQIWIDAHARNSGTNAPPAIVTARFLQAASTRHISFKLTNVSKEPVLLRPYQLPWGNSHSVTYAAVMADGQPLPNIYHIDDPPFQPQKVVAGPGESCEGEYDLERAVDFSHAPKDKDILVFWAYRLPVATVSSNLPSTGVIVIPKSQ